jgi:hypothetical protein
MLTGAGIDAFLADGFVAVRGAVPADIAAQCRDQIWSELEGRGVRRDDPSTWTDPVVRIDCPEGGPFAAAGTTARLWQCYDQLIGPGRWWRREGVGGTIPVRFPSPADPGDAGWHIESSFWADGQSRVNIVSRDRGLLAIFLLSDTGADSAPTRIRPGSHLDVPAVLAAAGRAGLPGHEAAVRAAACSAHRRTVLATGQAGDVFLCHPFLVHAASWPHRGRCPRMIAQPGVALFGEFALSPQLGAPPAPVEQAILDGLARAGVGADEYRQPEPSAKT